mmetsp:Transcript_137240/g.382824  ORF Transcript_137240/g.382824 Transcript_137240/m.382824 type:complete len:180 (+) Transcript_137240:61-600(+)
MLDAGTRWRPSDESVDMEVDGHRTWGMPTSLQRTADKDGARPSRKRASNLDVASSSQTWETSSRQGLGGEFFQHSSVLGILAEAGWDMEDFLRQCKKHRCVELSCGVGAADGIRGSLCAVCLAATTEASTVGCGHALCPNVACSKRCRGQWRHCAQCGAKVCGECNGGHFCDARLRFSP